MSRAASAAIGRRGRPGVAAGCVEAAEEGVAAGGSLDAGASAGGVRADEDLADGVVPDAAEDVDGLYGRAPAVDGSGHDGFDHPQGRFAEEADETVGGEDLGGPRPGGEGIVHRGGGSDDAVPRLAGQVGVRDLVRRIR